MDINADDLVDRVNCYRMGAWFEAFLGWAGAGWPVAADADGIWRMAAARRDLELWLVRERGFAAGDADGWRLDRLFFGSRASLPRGLAVAGETPERARGKLSADTVSGPAVEPGQGGRRISHFLAGGLVIELTFGPHDHGLSRVLVARLGAPIDRRGG